MAWAYAAEVADLDRHDVIGRVCHGRRIALYRLSAGIFASSDACPHAGAPLSRGCVVEGFIECPVHFSLFDIRTGEPQGGTTTRPLATFPTKVENGRIYVDLPAVEETIDER